MASPQILILAGPNGAGKTTSHRLLVPPPVPFVNADEIARDLRERGQGVGSAADIAAARLLIARLEELERMRASFAVETNLANRTLAQRIPRWQAAGYQVSVYYLRVPSADFAVARVQQRVLCGGHDIPEATIRRRFVQGLQNFSSVYSGLADWWRLYDSSGEAGPRIIARGSRHIRQPEANIRKAAGFEELMESESDEIDRLMQQAVHETLRRHKQRGQPIVIWRDGKTV